MLPGIVGWAKPSRADQHGCHALLLSSYSSTAISTILSSLF